MHELVFGRFGKSNKLRNHNRAAITPADAPEVITKIRFNSPRWVTARYASLRPNWEGSEFRAHFAGRMKYSTSNLQTGKVMAAHSYVVAVVICQRCQSCLHFDCCLRRYFRCPYCHMSPAVLRPLPTSTTAAYHPYDNECIDNPKL